MANCKGCGKAIVWAVNDNASRIPVEECKTAYHGVHSAEPIEGKTFDVMKPPTKIYISHFLTCTAANRFSGKNSKPKPAEMSVQSETLAAPIE